MKRDAKFSEDRKYRYVLDREWETSGKLVTFIMLNPSNADEVVDDRTIKRCIDFAKESGCGRLRVVNLFAYRSTDPRELEHIADPIGDGNDDDIRAAVGEAELVVCAWGDNASLVDKEQSRVKKVLGIIREEGKMPYTLGCPTKKGQPRHPSRLSGDTRPGPWK